MKTKQASAQNHTAKTDRKAGRIGTNCFRTSLGTGILRRSRADNGTMHMHEGELQEHGLSEAKHTKQGAHARDGVWSRLSLTLWVSNSGGLTTNMSHKRLSPSNGLAVENGSASTCCPIFVESNSGPCKQNASAS